MKKRVIASLSLLERDYRPCRGGNSEQFLVHPLVPMKEKLSHGVHMQPPQKEP